MLHLAIELATKAHLGQKRRGGEPYIEHCRRVALRLMEKGESDEVIATAWLHDAYEDGGITLFQLADSGLPFVVVKAVEIMAKGKEEPYEEYLVRVKANPITAKVKVADTLDNISDAHVTPKQILKYARGLLFLLS